MKVTITHLKAPWPEGAAVGSVVEVPGDSIPAAFAGKCVPAEEDAEASHVFEPKPAPVEEAPADPAKLAEDLKAAQALLDAERQAVAETAKRAEDAEAALALAHADAAALLKRAEDAETALAAAGHKGKK